MEMVRNEKGYIFDSPSSLSKKTPKSFDESHMLKKQSILNQEIYNPSLA